MIARSQIQYFYYDEFFFISFDLFWLKLPQLFRNGTERRWRQGPAQW